VKSRVSTSTIALALAVIAAALSGCWAVSSTPFGGSGSAGTPVLAAAAGVRFAYQDSAQVEIFAPSGHRIFIDVWESSRLSSPPTADDILLTTHGHSDHYVDYWANSFPGQKITFEPKSIRTAEVSITTIASTHDQAIPIIEADSTDYIFVIELAGLRIAHFGDIGQDKLSAEQLARIGKIDVAFSQLRNRFSTMDALNEKGINLMNQVRPLVFIPTHCNKDIAATAARTWRAAYSTTPITLTRESLPSETTIVFMGSYAADYKTLLNLNPAGW
jgi:L-ascorbate metabolism protein UlaG (beta-lactamase superfamily)